MRPMTRSRSDEALVGVPVAEDEEAAGAVAGVDSSNDAEEEGAASNASFLPDGVWGTEFRLKKVNRLLSFGVVLASAGSGSSTSNGTGVLRSSSVGEEVFSRRSPSSASTDGDLRERDFEQT